MENFDQWGDITSNDIALMINESSYTAYRVNAQHFIVIKNLTIPAEFHTEKKVAMITTGNSAPDWELQNLQGNIVTNAQLKGKVTLIDFSFNTYAACMLSIPTLKCSNQHQSPTYTKPMLGAGFLSRKASF